METALPPKPATGRFLFRVFFWVFNITLLLLVLLGFFPQFGLAIFRDALLGEVPLSILLPAIGLVGVPTTSTALSLQAKSKAQTKVKRPPITLVQIFYGIEAPLLMICTIRLFFLRDLTPASTLIFSSVALGTIAFIHWLLIARGEEETQANWLHLTGLTVLLMLSTYFAAIALFYVPPVLFTTVTAFAYILVFAIFLVIFFPLAVLFLGWTSMPFGMMAVLFKSWKQSFAQVSSHYGKHWARAGVVATMGLWIAALLFLQPQPQVKAFQLLDKPAQTDSDRQFLLQNADVIRQGLLNAYLNTYRYPSVDNRDIFHLYNYWVGEGTAQELQSLYNWVISPFAYQGDYTDKEKAAGLYAKFFDTPILRGEHSAIQTAVLSNFNRTEAKAGLLDINAERVQLEEQTVTVTPDGDWADIELHEVYANQTFENTEILYYFSLPESATITGLWLGETADLNQRYPYAVSPRGAAQQVYNDQVRRSVDPALLEQVGPRNYRLRAFPIPPKGRDVLPKDGQPDKMHLWMTYRVMKQDNQWQLPTLHEQRNIFWKQNTRRVVNGKQQKSRDKWLPSAIPADDVPLQAHQGKLPGGYIIAQPMADSEYQLPQQQKIALVLDGSYSMRSHQAEVKDALQWLKQEILPRNNVDLFVTKVDAQKAESIGKIEDLAQTVSYGWLQPSQMLQQFQAASGAENYDAIVLLTDSGSYELTEDGTPVELDAPLWLVHLGGVQAAYDDATLEAIQRTGGNVGTDIKTVMQRLATQPTLGDGTSLLNVVDGYAWHLSQTPDTSQAIEPELAPLAARQWITQVSQAVKPSDLTQLDAIHQVAKDNSIVTPYSSMIVLVNDAQRQQLKEAETKGDRFNREVEDQQLPDPQNNLPQNVTAVPEPEEWLLLLIGLILLGAIYHRQRTAST